MPSERLTVLPHPDVRDAERHWAEQDARESRRRLERRFDSVEVALVLVGADGRVLRLSEALRRSETLAAIGTLASGREPPRIVA